MASVRRCCVCGKFRSSDVILHAFPNPAQELDKYHEWIRAVGKKVSSLDPQHVFKNRKLCHDHFDKKFLTRSRKLSCIAVPTLLLPESENVEPPVMDPNKLSSDNSNNSSGEELLSPESSKSGGTVNTQSVTSVPQTISSAPECTAAPDTVTEIKVEYDGSSNHSNKETTACYDVKVEMSNEVMDSTNENEETSEREEYLDKYTLKILKENTLTLITNSNMCVFRSAKSGFSCYCCDNVYAAIEELREHRKRQPIQTIVDRVYKFKIALYLYVDISSLICKLCQLPLDDLTSLMKHLTITHKIQFEDDINLLIPYKLKDGYACVHCEADFKTFTGLSMHMNIHYPNHVCEI